MFLPFLCKGHKYVTENFLEQMNSGECVRAALPVEGDKCPQQVSEDFSTPLSPCPLPSAEPGTGIANISCQFIFISQCLAAASKNTPTALVDSSKDRKWRVLASPVPSTLPGPYMEMETGSPPTGCLEKSTQHQRDRSALSLRVTPEVKKYN